jgi:hypothetical protein
MDPRPGLDHVDVDPVRTHGATSRLALQIGLRWLPDANQNALHFALHCMICFA